MTTLTEADVEQAALAAQPISQDDPSTLLSP